MHHLILITSARYASVGTDYLTVSVWHSYLTVSVHGLRCFPRASHTNLKKANKTRRTGLKQNKNKNVNKK
ncbi:hypothetical protein [Methanimicrococcus hacksteinii]|uniref:hypothetical protein n=1 Tax=Methanimicrococcus hacksteinii TaxID=3028293 RepID=UPI00298F0848|nr:hypothetical protein [Methanimicrococcus sp. At1]